MKTFLDLILEQDKCDAIESDEKRNVFLALVGPRISFCSIYLFKCICLLGEAYTSVDKKSVAKTSFL